MLSPNPKKGRVVRVRSSDNPVFRDNICMKGIVAPKGFANPSRVLYPLKRVGERGSGKWEQVTWDEAFADIGTRLKKIIADHGPEAWAVSSTMYNAPDHGLCRRVMNYIGSPNWTSGVALCAGNTASVSRYTYGWFPLADIGKTNCIMLLGHNPRRHSWTPVYNMIRQAQARGAKLIVVDPRKSSSAKRADIWLPIKVGSDGALLFGMLKVIIDEELYDKDFVKNWTVGFEEFKQRVDEFPLERVAKLTGCDPEMIAKAARLFATSGPACIPWTPITDMQRNSTSAIRLQASLRAICGYVDVPGGDLLQGMTPDTNCQSMVESHHVISEEQKAKQLGSDDHPVFTFRGQDIFREPTKKVWGLEYANICNGTAMTPPSALFRAMAGEGPYPVKAFFIVGNNPIMSYGNMKLVMKAVMNQDLVVANEQHITPSAQLADYILPADSWLERPMLLDMMGWATPYGFSQQSMEPPGECRSSWQFWKEVANSLDRPEIVPWDTIEDCFDYMLEPLGKTWKELSESTSIHLPPPRYRKYLKTGFATPSGKVELKSDALGDLGFDPLPYFREDPPVDPEYPLQFFTGVRDDTYFQTCQRHIDELRAMIPEPEGFIGPGTAEQYGLKDSDWMEVENQLSSVLVKVAVKEKMPDGLVRLPHGWWKPEMEQGVDCLSGALRYADAQVCRDDNDYLDQEQGIPHLKGVACRIRKTAVPLEVKAGTEEKAMALAK